MRNVIDMKKKDDIELEMQETVVEEPAVQEEVSMKDEAAEMRRRMWSDEEHGAQIALRGETKTSEQQEDTLSLRGAIGLVLRDLRSRDHKTLREVSEKAGVSLGYLSEVERGQKEASSELLSSIAEALGVSTAQLLRMVADRLDMAA